MAVNTITGTTGNDLLQGQQLSGTQNQLNGLAGNDTLIAATVSDTLNGGAGNDSLSYGTGLTVNGAQAVGGLGDDTFFAVGTTLLAGSYAGESGNDLFSFTAATNITSTSVRGGEGADTITLIGGGAALNGFVATMGQGADLLNFTGSTFNGGQVFGGKDNDTIQFANNANSLSLGSNDGADRIEIGTATLLNSVIGGGKGHDIITTTALAGDLVATLSTIVGGLGTDSINLTFRNATTTTNLTVFGDSSGDSTVGLADFINFSANGATEVGASSIYGGAGNDTIVFGGIANAANTAFAINTFGGLGDDSISFNAAGANSLRGGQGNDTLIATYIAFSAGSVASGLNFNGGAGVDQIVLQNSAAQAWSAATGGYFANQGNFVIGSFSDAGDNILLGNVATNTAAFSGVNFLNTGSQVVAGVAVDRLTGGAGTATTFSGAFVYNMTGGFSTAQMDGIALSASFKAGDMNIFEAGGDTIVQIVTFVGTGGVLGAGATAAASANILTWNFSGNLGIIDNGTAGFISTTGVNLNFGIAQNASGRNGFTITFG